MSPHCLIAPYCHPHTATITRDTPPSHFPSQSTERESIETPVHQTYFLRYHLNSHKRPVIYLKRNFYGTRHCGSSSVFLQYSLPLKHFPVPGEKRKTSQLRHYFLFPDNQASNYYGIMPLLFEKMLFANSPPFRQEDCQDISKIPTTNATDEAFALFQKEFYDCFGRIRKLKAIPAPVKTARTSNIF